MFLIFRKFGMLCFLGTPILRFTLLPYYQQILIRKMHCNFLNRLADFSCRFKHNIKKPDKNSIFLLQCKNACKINIHKSPSQNIPTGYLPAQNQQWKLWNRLCNLFIVNKKTSEWPHWHEDNKGTVMQTI